MSEVAVRPDFLPLELCAFGASTTHRPYVLSFPCVGQHKHRWSPTCLETPSHLVTNREGPSLYKNLYYPVLCHVEWFEEAGGMDGCTGSNAGDLNYPCARCTATGIALTSVLQHNYVHFISAFPHGQVGGFSKWEKPISKW